MPHGHIASQHGASRLSAGFAYARQPISLAYCEPALGAPAGTATMATSVLAR